MSDTSGIEATDPSDATALRLDIRKKTTFPRVAAKARQPWALGRNRVAVYKVKCELGSRAN